MGARGNCVIVEQGHAQMFYGQWVAMYIPAMLLSGPQRTIEQIRGIRPVDHLTDTVWAEGGLVVNCDTRTVVYFGGERYTIPHVRRYGPLLWQQLWPGWNISWAIYGQPDIARACGVDPVSVIDTNYDDEAFLFGNDALVMPRHILSLTEPAVVEYRERKILSVRFSDGTVVDYELGAVDTHEGNELDYILTLGPALGDILPSLAPAALQREDRYYKGVALDFQQRIMLIWERWDLNERKVTALERRWSEWTIQTPGDGPVQHMALLGRDPSSFLVPKSECMQEMITTLLDYLPHAEREEKRRLIMQILQDAVE